MDAIVAIGAISLVVLIVIDYFWLRKRANQEDGSDDDWLGV